MSDENSTAKPWKSYLLVGGALGCLFLYEEMICSGLMLTDTALSSVMYPLYCLVQALVFLPALAFPSLVERARIVPVAIAGALFMATGASVAIVAQGSLSFILSFGGFLLAAAGPALFKPPLFLRMAYFPLNAIKLIVMGAFLARFFVMLLPMLLPATADALIFLLGPLAAAFWITVPRFGDPSAPPAVRIAIAPRALVPVSVAFVILTVGCTALSPLSVDPSFSYIGSGPFGGATGWIVTQSAAALVIAVLLFALPDLAYATAAKTVGTTAVLAFVVFMGAGAIKVSWNVSLVALNLLMFIPLVAIVDFASYAAFRPARIIAGYLVAYEGSVAAGSLLGLAETTLEPLFGTVTILGLALCCLVVISVVWLATERNMDRFFWGPALSVAASRSPSDAGSSSQPARPETAPPATPDARATAEAIAVEHGLTARETDVLELLTRGRSATFIAEELCLSPNTVRTHVSRIYAKCGVHSKQELLTLAQGHEGRGNAKA